MSESQEVVAAVCEGLERRKVYRVGDVYWTDICPAMPGRFIVESREPFADFMDNFSSNYDNGRRWVEPHEYMLQEGSLGAPLNLVAWRRVVTEVDSVDDIYELITPEECAVRQLSK